MIRKFSFLFFVLFYLSVQSLAQHPQGLTFFRENIKKAEELFLQLKKWQEDKDWENFFSFKEKYFKEIVELLSPIDKPLLLKLQAHYLLLRLKYLLDLKDVKQEEELFLKELEGVKTGDPELISFLKKVLSEIPPENRQFKRKVTSLYIEFLQKSKSSQVLREELESFYNQKDIETFSKLAKSYLNLIRGEKEFKEEAKNFIERSICDGFKEYCQPYFAEELFKEFSDLDDISSDWLYLRAYNLEKASEYEKAVSAYKNFLDKFPESPLLDEVIWRLGFIYLYKLSDFSQAEEYFLKLKDRGFKVDRYLNVMKDRVNLEKLSYNEEMFLRALKEKDLFLKGRLQIDSCPARAFLGQRVNLKSLSLSPDTGCLQPQGLFLWSGDLGGVKIVTNTPSFQTSFKKEGFKIINLVEVVTGDTFSGLDSCFFNIYRLEVIKKKVKGKSIGLEVKVFPPLPESLLEVFWRAEKEGKVVWEKEGKTFSGELSPDYLLRVYLSFLGKVIYSEEIPLDFLKS